MKIKRMTVLLLALICIGAMLISCGSEFNADKWTDDIQKTKRSASYTNLNDEKYYKIDVDGKIDMSITVNTISGDAFVAEIYNVKYQQTPVYKLAITRNSDGVLEASVSYAENQTQTQISNIFTDSITIAGDNDDFVIHIMGINHTGSFTFDW